jgi:hypothetical protein
MLPVSLRARSAARAVGDRRVMFFLLRLAFWLGIVLILLPTGSAQREPAAKDVGAPEAISAASATVQDLRGFCARQPEACSVGSQMMTEAGFKLQAGAKMLYNLLTVELAKHRAGSSPDAVAEHSVVNTDFDKSWSLRGSQDTLIPADLAPAWRGPSAHQNAKPAA